jgi:hypothetical protein
MREGKSSSINNNLAVDRLAHNPKVGGSNPPPATNAIIELRGIGFVDCGLKWSNKVRTATAKAVTRRPFAIWCDLEPTRAARRMRWLCGSIP